MAEYILEILKSQIMVLFSWGPHNFKRLPGDKGLSFHVNGFRHQGMVKVVYDEGQDLFEVHLDDGQVEDMVYADCLVQVIDGLVERIDNYKDRVETEYQIHAN